RDASLGDAALAVKGSHSDDAPDAGEAPAVKPHGSSHSSLDGGNPEPQTSEPSKPGPKPTKPVTPSPNDAEPTGTNPADPGPVDPAGPEPVNPGPDPGGPASMDAGPLGPGPVDPEPVDPSPTSTEPVSPGPTSTEPVDPAPTSTEPVTPEPTTPVTPEPTTPEPTSTTPVEPPPGELVSNGDFADGLTHWNVDLSSGEVTVSGGVACVGPEASSYYAIGTLGWPNDPDVAFPVVDGGIYEFSFDAWFTSTPYSSSMEAKVGEAVEPYSSLITWYATVGTDHTHFSTQFQAIGDLPQVGIAFNVDLEDDSFCVDNVSIVRVQ
ncbi:MAG TPA: carbohydrate binding domain-containing protein, partial [Polyangiaceae bacterium]|nr:carbohydrate binding domain-containing protein [Polyangiaceae bacterium]